MLTKAELLQIKKIISAGGIIAYPTEAVYGLGCDPFNEKALAQLLKIKQRPATKGFIIIVSSWQQMQALVQPLDAKLLEKVYSTWPGPVTWLFPVLPNISQQLRGNHDRIAIRMTAHPIAKQICHFLDMAIISTSANISQQPPLTTAKQVKQCFGDKIDHIVAGPVGNLAKPTVIRDVISGETIRD